ncbi:MAG: CBS domain-containing protein [Candidatus Woesearchaeota archaeon]
MKTGYKVCDAMTREPITVSPETSICDCARIMKQKHVGGLLITEGKKLRGIITEQDIVRKAVAQNIDCSKVPVKKLMVKKLITIGPEADIYNALIKMRDNNIRHLPIVDGQNIIGLLTIKDILKIQPELFDLIVEKFEIREEEHKPVRTISNSVCELCGNPAKKLYRVKDMLVCVECRSKL